MEIRADLLDDNQVFSQELIDKLQINIIRLDIYKKILYISQAVKEFLAIQNDEIIGKDLTEAISSEIYDKYFSLFFAPKGNYNCAFNSIFPARESGHSIQLFEISSVERFDPQKNQIGSDLIFSPYETDERQNNFLEILLPILDKINFGADIYKLEKSDDYKSLRLLYTNPVSHSKQFATKKRVPGLTIDKILKEPEHNDLMYMTAESVRTGIPFYNDEFVFESKKTAQLCFSFSVIPFFGKYVIIFFRDNTEKKDAETALKDNQRQLATLISNLPGMIYRFKNDECWTITFASTGCYELSGYQPEEFINNSIEAFQDLINIDDVQILRNEISLALKQKIQYKVSYKIKTKSGENKLVWEQGKGVFNENGEFEYVEALIIDISERMEICGNLEKSERKFRSLVENMRDGLAVRDIDGKVLYINRILFSILGIPETYDKSWEIGNYVDKNTSDLIHFEFDRLKHGIIEMAEIEFEAKKTDNTHIWLELRMFPFFSEDGSINGFQSIFHDITERKNAAEVARLKSEYFMKVFQIAPYAMLLAEIDPSYILNVNSATEKLFEIDREELIGQIGLNLLDEGTALKIQDEFSLKNEINDFEFSIISGKGNSKTVQVSSRVIEFENSHCVLHVFIDITDKKRVEMELYNHRKHLERIIKERTTELEEVNILLHKENVKQKKAELKVKSALEKEKELSDMKTRFISIASHQFRTPLTTIYSSAQLLEKYGRQWDDEIYKSQFARIKEYVHYLTEIMDDMLTISRTSSGKIIFEPKITDMESLLENIIIDIKTFLTPAHKVTKDIKLTEKFFFIDEKLIKYILLNLLSNAIKYSPRGGTIELSIRDEEKKLIMKVSDEGLGIPDKDKKNLFEPFHRGLNVGEINGTGLGMSIIKKSVDLHKGKIEFFSIENKGTTFTVIIPLKAK